MSCRCMFLSCVHPVAVLNVAFGMTCRLLMQVENARGDHTEEANYMTAIWLNPFATVIFTVCSQVTVECCVLPVFRGDVGYVCCYVRNKALPQCLCNY